VPELPDTCAVTFSRSENVVKDSGFLRALGRLSVVGLQCIPPGLGAKDGAFLREDGDFVGRGPPRQEGPR
jgi:hypothetical protein